MKKTVTLFLCLSIFFVGSAQVSKILDKAHYQNVFDLTKTVSGGINQQKGGKFNLPQRTKISALKQKGNIKQRLDSVVQWMFDGSMMVIKYKSLYTYDNAGNIIMEIVYEFNKTSGVWIIREKNDYSYDEFSNVTMAAFYFRPNNSNMWLKVSKTEYTYNAENLMATCIISYANNYNEWVYSTKFEYEYNQSGNKSIEIEYTWNVNTFERIKKREFSYNEFNNLSTSLGYWRNANEWILSIKTDVFYDNYQNDTTTLIYNRINDEWNLSSKYLNKYEYDSNGKLINTIISNGNSEEHFDSNGNRDIYSHYILNSSTNKKYCILKEEYLFDFSYLNSDILKVDFLNKSVYINKLINFKTYNNTGTDLRLYQDIYLYYSSQEISTAATQVKNDKITVFPNPVTSSFQISGVEGTSNVSISDLSGKVVFSKKITGYENIPVANLAKGMYIVRIITKEGTIEKKIIKD